jgi:hypothetical protein
MDMSAPGTDRPHTAPRAHVGWRTDGETAAAVVLPASTARLPERRCPWKKHAASGLGRPSLAALFASRS